MEINEDLAEAIGIMLGDGSVTFPTEKYNTHQIRIGLNAKTEIEYASEFILPLLEKILDTECTCRVAPRNEVFVSINRKNDVIRISKFMDWENKLIPKFVREDDELLKACIRGLIDTDGSVFSKTTNENLPVIEFYQKDRNLMEQVRNGLLKLGIKCSKIMKKKTKLCVGIYHQDGVEKYINVVGFSSKKNKDRYRSIIGKPR